MKLVNEEFAVLYYIFEKIIEYVELTAKDYLKCMKWKNIKTLLRLAVVNNRINRGASTFFGK